MKGLREKLLDRVSTLSVDGMTMAPVRGKESVSRTLLLQTGETAELQQGEPGEEGGEDASRCDDSHRLPGRFLSCRTSPP